MTEEQRKKDAAAIWEQAAKESVYVSDSLKDRIDLSSSDEEWDFRPVKKVGLRSVVYYEHLSDGIEGEFIAAKKEHNGFLIGMEVHPEMIGDILSCPDIIRVVVTIDETIVYEKDFDETWTERSREIIRNGDRIELYISLHEGDN